MGEAAIDPASGIARLSEFESWDGVSESSLRTALSDAVVYCIERDLIGRCSEFSRFRGHCGKLGLLVTTRSAYRHPIAKPFIEVLASRAGLSQDLRERAGTGVQEALMNAVLHGNLGIASRERDSLPALVNTAAKIEGLLTSPQIATRTVYIEAIWNATTLHIIVRDSGDGFEISGRTCAEVWRSRGAAPNGRGLSILTAICDKVVLLNGGRSIKLGFRR